MQGMLHQCLHWVGGSARCTGGWSGFCCEWSMRHGQPALITAYMVYPSSYRKGRMGKLIFDLTTMEWESIWCTRLRTQSIRIVKSSLGRYLWSDRGIPRWFIWGKLHNSRGKRPGLWFGEPSGSLMGDPSANGKVPLQGCCPDAGP